MRERGSIVYDFDGTWTDSYAEMEPVLRSLPEYFQTRFGIEPLVFWRIWGRMEDDVIDNHEGFGISKHPNGKIITAPLSSSIFELYACILSYVLDYFANSGEVSLWFRQSFRNALLHIVSPCSSSGGRAVGKVDLTAVARIIFTSLLQEIPLRSKTVFRPGLEDNIRFALDRGFDVAVISNSPKEVIAAKISTRESLRDLVRRIGWDRIVGSAGKDRVYPNWDGRVEVSRCSRVRGVPERIRITKYGLNRPIYMLRQSFADHLERLGFTRAFPRFAVGDCVENDLLLAHMLHADVGLVDHPHLPDHERRWAEGEMGARVIRFFEDVSEMLSAAA